MPVTNPPIGSRVIKRTARTGSLQGEDYFRITEWAYDYVTRSAAAYTPADSLDNTEFSLDPAEVIDAWCLSNGDAPFTERRVTHNGTGGLAFTNVDNVRACMRLCTLGLTLAASPMSDGRADITASATDAQGPVEFSLDNFATPGFAPYPTETGLPGYDFRRLRPDTYTVYVRETRSGGCTARATITLTATYGPRYQHTWKDADQTTLRLRIWEREYSGDVEVVKAQPTPVTLDWSGSAGEHVFSGLLQGSEAQLALLLEATDQYLPLYSGDERLHLVTFEKNNTLFWKGYLLPEQYDVALLAPPKAFNLSATDGLGTLGTVPFTGPAGQRLSGDWTLLDALLFCLNKLDLDLNLHTLLNLYPAGTTLGAAALEQTAVDVAGYADEDGTPWTCGEVVTAILTAFQARLCQWQGAWWLERLKELGTGELTYASYSPAGSRNLSDPTRTLLTAVGLPVAAPYWVDAAQRQNLKGAVAYVEVTADAGDKPSNVLRFALPQNSDLPAARPASWSGYTTTPAQPYSQLIYQGKDEAPALRLVGTTDSGSFGGFAQPVDDAKRRAQPWVQTPATTPMPADALFLVLRFKVKAYGVTPNDNDLYQSQLPVAIKFGDVWLGPGGLPEDTAPVFSWVSLPDDKEVEAAIGGWVLRTPANLRGPQPASVRFYAPVGGKTAATAVITDIRLEVGDTIGGPDTRVDTSRYTVETGRLVSRTDEGLTLFHADTPGARFPGTLLTTNGRPVQGWFEAGQPGQVRELGDFLAADRALWQFAPAQVLTGNLRGPLPHGPNTLLTDPNEPRPGVYVLTSATHDTSANTWQIEAVQLVTLPAPGGEVPADAIYHENGGLLLAEDGSIMTYEHV